MVVTSVSDIRELRRLRRQVLGGLAARWPTDSLSTRLNFIVHDGCVHSPDCPVVYGSSHISDWSGTVEELFAVPESCVCVTDRRNLGRVARWLDSITALESFDRHLDTVTANPSYVAYHVVCAAERELKIAEANVLRRVGGASELIAALEYRRSQMPELHRVASGWGSRRADTDAWLWWAARKHHFCPNTPANLIVSAVRELADPYRVADAAGAAGTAALDELRHGVGDVAEVPFLMWNVHRGFDLDVACAQCDIIVDDRKGLAVGSAPQVVLSELLRVRMGARYIPLNGVAPKAYQFLVEMWDDPNRVHELVALAASL